MILTFDLVSRMIVSGEHIFHSIGYRNPKFGVLVPLGMAEMWMPFRVTLTMTLTYGLTFRFLFVSGAYLLYYS